METSIQTNPEFKQNCTTSDDADLSDLSHQFRTSLHTILMSVELLKTEKSSSRKMETKYYLQHIRVAVKHMNEILKQNEEL